MLSTKRFLALSAALLASMTTLAAAPKAPATVDAVVTPAWLDRKGRTEPLAIGTEVRNGDRIRTGNGARVYLRLAEGSTVKIGADATLKFFSRSLRPERNFKAALDVAAGAFRFTTGLAARLRSRDVTVRVGTATAGIRGTDVWGRTMAEQDLVCLIEGRVEVAHAGFAEPAALSEPLSCVFATRGAAPVVGRADAAQMERLARETEILPGDGAQRADGNWKLAVGRYATQAAALEQYDLVRSAGFAPKIVPKASEAGGWEYDVVLGGFAGESDAQAAGARLKAVTGLEATATQGN